MMSRQIFFSLSFTGQGTAIPWLVCGKGVETRGSWVEATNAFVQEFDRACVVCVVNEEVTHPKAVIAAVYVRTRRTRRTRRA